MFHGNTGGCNFVGKLEKVEVERSAVHPWLSDLSHSAERQREQH
jgi:hypothetical protein